ncbi:hypothetical protein SAMN05216390_11736 [Lachnospiraceae bacterium KH1T2]|nr:hypothetical protein SAMN05216390_11736 [Lachnospiraceae bacterium KH1T2]
MRGVLRFFSVIGVTLSVSVLCLNEVHAEKLPLEQKSIMVASTVDVSIKPSSGGGHHKSHKETEEEKKARIKQEEVELSRKAIEANKDNGEAYTPASDVTDDSTELTEEQLLQIQAIQQAQMSSSNAESDQNTTKTKKVGNKSSKKKEPKTAGTDLPVIPIALVTLGLDFYCVLVESGYVYKKKKKKI